MNWNDVTAFITGANRGIGRAFIDALFARGAAKVYGGVRDPANLADAVAAHGDKVVPVPIEVTDPESAKTAAAQCPDTTLLINNAGATGFNGYLTDAAIADAERIFAVNFYGPLYLTRAFAPALRSHQGGMILVLSMAGLMCPSQVAIYGASKAAGSFMGHALRADLKDDGVTVSMVYPGFVDTRLAAGYELPKVTPAQIAERSLDGWARGDASIFPDHFSQMVEHALKTRTEQWLADPGALTAALVGDFLQSDKAGT